jgi:hypothetical protein
MPRAHGLVTTRSAAGRSKGRLQSPRLGLHSKTVTLDVERFARNTYFQRPDVQFQASRPARFQDDGMVAVHRAGVRLGNSSVAGSRKLFNQRGSHHPCLTDVGRSRCRASPEASSEPVGALGERAACGWEKAGAAVCRAGAGVHRERLRAPIRLCTPRRTMGAIGCAWPTRAISPLPPYGARSVVEPRLAEKASLTY